MSDANPTSFDEFLSHKVGLKSTHILSMMLNLCPTKRSSIDDLLNHPYLKQVGSLDEHSKHYQFSIERIDDKLLNSRNNDMKRKWKWLEARQSSFVLIPLLRSTIRRILVLAVGVLKDISSKLFSIPRPFLDKLIIYILSNSYSELLSEFK